MKAYIYRKKKYSGSYQLYSILINNIEKYSLENGEEKIVNLKKGVYEIRVKSFLPKEAVMSDPFSKIIQKTTHAKSNSIEVCVDSSNVESSIYLLIEPWAKNVLLELSFPFIWIYKILIYRKRQGRLLIKHVTKTDFNTKKKERYRNSIFNDKKLPKGEATQKVVRNDLISSLLLIIFGLGIIMFLHQKENNDWGILILLLGTGAITKIPPYLRNKTIEYSYIIFFIKNILTIIVLALSIVILLQSIVCVAICLCFILFYIYAIFKVQSLFNKL